MLTIEIFIAAEVYCHHINVKIFKHENYKSFIRHIEKYYFLLSASHFSVMIIKPTRHREKIFKNIFLKHEDKFLSQSATNYVPINFCKMCSLRKLCHSRAIKS